MTDLERRITATKAALDGARAAHAHSPNPETERLMRGVEGRLDQLLDQWAHSKQAEEIVSA